MIAALEHEDWYRMYDEKVAAAVARFRSRQDALGRKEAQLEAAIDVFEKEVAALRARLEASERGGYEPEGYAADFAELKRRKLGANKYSSVRGCGSGGCML